MFKKFIKEVFSQLDYNEIEERIYDHIKKICFIIRVVENNNVIEKAAIKNELKAIYYKDYKIVGIVLLKNVSHLLSVDVFFDKVLILIGQEENLTEIFKNIIENINLIFSKDQNDITVPYSYKELNLIKKMNMDTIKLIDNLLSSRLKTLLESHKESLYHDILFSEKIDKKRLMLKYSEHKEEIVNLKNTVLKAKEYFKCKYSA